MENSEDTALSGYEQVYENGREQIESSVNKQKRQTRPGKLSVT